jgi:transcription initiation factor TFIIIB Brf1 subunit/transcription initiation factor TFIIB
MELGGQQYTQWKNELIMMERYILKELGFSLYNIMDHPHKYILYFVKVLNGSEALANTAWSYLNDSMRLDISLRFEAQAIACAAIFLAGRKLSVALPESGEAGPWWQVFGATTRDVQSISDAILTIYETPKVISLVSFLVCLMVDCRS